MTIYFIAAVHLFLFIFGLSFWKKYKDRSFLAGSLINIFALLVDGWYFASKNLLNLSMQIQSISDSFVVIFWITSFVLTVFVMLKNKRLE